EIDHELELGRLLDREVRGLGALQDPAGVDARTAICVRLAGSVAHQTARQGELTQWVARGHRVADRQCGQLFDPASEGWVGADHERAYSQLVQGCNDRLEVAFVARVQDMHLQPEGTGRRL